MVQWSAQPSMKGSAFSYRTFFLLPYDESEIMAETTDFGLRGM